MLSRRERKTLSRRRRTWSVSEQGVWDITGNRETNYKTPSSSSGYRKRRLSG